MNSTSRGSSIRQRPEGTISPRVSVVIAAYGSHATIARCLESLEAQTCQDFELIVIDSSPDDRTADVVRARFPNVNYWHSPTRLYPHAARNEGARRASAQILVFTDPDIYARPDWLQQMLQAHGETRAAVVGAINCYGACWLDRGIHIAKFSKWLPGGSRREVDMGPTATLLVRRSDYDAANGFSDDLILGDIEFSWTLRARGRALIFEPRAVVEHHHIQSFRQFFLERWNRGIMYGDLRSEHRADGGLGLLGWFLVTALPVRFARNAALVTVQCSKASRLRELAATAPVVAAGYAASLGGEAFAYAHRLRSIWSRRRA
jgi:GT2 family glycosyltransferase